MIYTGGNPNKCLFIMSDICVMLPEYSGHFRTSHALISNILNQTHDLIDRLISVTFDVFDSFFID